ncbi:polyhydroxyalkanoate synthesis regulator phasin [Evansella vedderi]|uniref:Polyhydroxyalkanoate synthesis regulator phasin n=1 Tax=Evansella vedderi TaxID=38282 RepID=A0ABT9ZTQ0_9BACI|nr:hypothetical protein [Evansella vedderi]MDQ0254608.1 polyhydroxyalkanoate synthesis regulator phasin [Evansella vedderi]
MSVLNQEEVIKFFKLYGFRVDEVSVREWVKENNKKANTSDKIRPTIEDDLLKYNHWCIVKGTAYEEGIDDQTKISRLLEEVELLRKEVEDLKNEKYDLEKLLGKNTWI